MYSIYLSKPDLLNLSISNTEKHEFSCYWKWIGWCNDVMNHVECVINRDVYVQKMHSCSKNIRGIYRQHVYSAAVYKKYLTKLGELTTFEP